ncbi:GFA family protein [Thalassotalea marina]|nr:GFA family protein [Thalassotalea marina]
MNQGSCLCGKVQFKVTKFLPAVAHCHCSMCRKFHGAAFSTYAEVSLEDFTVTAGEQLLQSYQAANGTVRKFCKCCGSSLIFESRYNRQDKTIEIALAAFDVIEHVAPNAHIYLSSKVDWFEPNDELPKFKDFRE